MAKKKPKKPASAACAVALPAAKGGPVVIRLKEFLQNFHDTDQYAPDRAFCFIIGSGAAHTSGIPTGASLVNRWLVEMHDMDDAADKRILPPHANIEDYADALLEGEKERLKRWSEKRFEKLDGYTFEERARFYGHIYKARFSSDPDLGQQFLRKLIHRKKPSIGFHLLARILNRTRHNVVITTNFDHLVEDSIAITEHEAVQSFNHAGLAEFVQSRPEHPAVAKIHGDILLKSFNAAEELDQLSEQWAKPLRALFQTYTPIVIGYGGNDPGFMRFLLKELQTWGDERRCYWFVRKEAEFQCIPSCLQLGAVKVLRRVECPGFTELMLKLNEIFNYEPLHEEMKKRAETIAAELRDADVKARGDLDELERRNIESLRARKGIAETKLDSSVLASSTQEAKLTWRDWRSKITESPNADTRKLVLAEALQAFPGSLSLQSVAAACDLGNNPGNHTPLKFIHALLKESEARYGPECEETLVVLHSLGVAFSEIGEPEKSEALHRRVIAGLDRLLGAEHPDTLSARNNLAVALQYQGKYTEAEQELRTVLNVQERILGPDHHSTISIRNNLAAALQAQGKQAEAEHEFRTMVKIRERILGADHPGTLMSRNNLAATLHGQNKYAEAEQEHRDILAIRKRVLGAEHPNVAQSCYNLAQCLEAQNKLKEALGFMQQAEAARTKHLGTDHPYSKAAKQARERIEAAMKNK